ncbi:GNAT family N-acetyltransferase [Nocardia donostiensis]|uniref:GNAT family N-acetyltransferase n=1 Tax=Nocardia donostiensis TaxID=1538463 RepID=UPI001FE4D9FA|nr:GNAT family protein [Nocardia donostiensis]
MIVYPSSSNRVSSYGVGSTGTPTLTGRKVRLRELEPDDRQTLTSFDRASSANRPPQVGGHQHWAAHRDPGPDSADDLQFVIESRYGGMLVGSVSAAATDSQAGLFSYSIGIGPLFRRCGYASDAIAVLLAHMFGERGYRECEVSIYGGNLGSLSLHGVIGFREKQRIPDTEVMRGRIRYMVVMSITAGEFAALHPGFTATGYPAASPRGRHWRARRGQHWRVPRPPLF